jgi:hypothetical protein
MERNQGGDLMAIQKKPKAKVRATTADIMKAKTAPGEPIFGREKTTPLFKEIDKPALTQISAKIPAELHTKVRIKCLESGQEMQKVIAELLDTWVRK